MEILREINLSDFRESKTAVDKISEALNFNFDQFLPLSGSEIDQNQNSNF